MEFIIHATETTDKRSKWRKFIDSIKSFRLWCDHDWGDANYCHPFSIFSMSGSELDKARYQMCRKCGETRRAF